MMKKIISLLCAVVCIGMVRAQWTEDITKNTLISESGKSYCAHIKASAAPNGNIFVSWLSYEGVGEGDDVYSQGMTKLQLLDKNGKALWNEGGIYVSKHATATWSSDFSMVTTSDGCAIIAFSDSRTDLINKQDFKTYVYKIDQEGNFLWGLDGVALPTNSILCMHPRICITNSGSVIVGYTDQEKKGFVMNRIDKDGTLVWGESLMINGMEGNFSACKEDDFIVVLMAEDNSLIAYRFDAYGEEQWNKTISKDAIYPYVEPVVKSDGQDGAIVSYMIGGENPQEFYVCLQRINADSEVMMGIKPIRTSDEVAAHNGVAYGVDTKNESIVSLWQKSLYDTHKLSVTKLNFFGDKLWDKNGIELEAKDMWDFIPEEVIITEDGGSIMFYRDNIDATNSIVKALKLDKDGTMVWKKDMSHYSFKSKCAVAPCTDQICVFWADARNSDQVTGGEVYGQNISYNGDFGTITSIENTQASNRNNDVYYDNITRTLNIFIADALNSVNLELYSLSGYLLDRYNNLPVNDNRANVTTKSLLPGTYIIKVMYGENQNSYKKIMVR